MTAAPALHAPHQFGRLGIRIVTRSRRRQLAFTVVRVFWGLLDAPHLEAAALLVADLAALETLDDVLLGALARLVAHLVALEAELGVALEAVVGVRAAQDAV